MRLVILGGPGAGKGTQAEQLCHRLRIPWISTGEMLIAAIATQADLGKQAASYVEQGELVPDEIMIELIRQRLLLPDTRQGWLLDGYPRTAFQAEELDFLLEDLHQGLDWGIYLNVPDPILMERSLGRSRLDDKPGAIQRRIELFHQRTVPILEYYSPRGRLLEIQGDQSPQQIQQEILQGLKID
ncbi:MAG: adenylate kinase [Oscillatoriales cyanobacterium RM1_1_9]|nr:adenylate kinase [Oscillatoriales cyanobacterium SM2_3_0]NJO47974.1 adenylate kinase [Oscillatoriales cyanobacterium RM2_1_1]NJO71006.1 adenylate kinase [Oscillatoriales cyanobacterium RM1_1_9]